MVINANAHLLGAMNITCQLEVSLFLHVTQVKQNLNCIADKKGCTNTHVAYGCPTWWWY